MSDEGTQDHQDKADGEFDLDEETASDLDAAMREALEAIEQGESAAPATATPVDTEASELEEDIVVSEIASGELEELRAEATAQKEKALRTLADFENFRKRVQREREDESRFRAFEPMRNLLDVVDNLERAATSSGSIEDLKQGVEMIIRQMGGLLKENGVESVQAAEQPFDPSVHEAVSRHEDPSLSVPMVSEVLQQGYTMHGRLLRPAVVRVAMPSSNEVPVNNTDES